MSQKLLPSVHLLELFMPYRKDEERMLDVLRKTVEMDFYKGVELCSFAGKYNRMYVRDILEQNHLNAMTFVTPYVKEEKMSLSHLDESERRKAVEFVKRHAGYASDCGYTNFGIPSGDDPGDQHRAKAKKLLADVMVELADYLKGLGLNLILEPLDRYAFKKQLIGPMKESMIWFAPIHEACPNTYIHWDSAHESLGKINLLSSLEMAAPYLSQFHLANAILDTNHPCYGDLHMDCGVAPDFKSDGFLTPEIGAQLLQKVASFDTAPGIKNTYVSMEVLSHPGDDMWLKERNAREFLCRCFELAGMSIR